ncbi:MAG: TetR/AcrR family transcriptional regulator [Acidimicrobiales bacterium]
MVVNLVGGPLPITGPRRQAGRCTPAAGPRGRRERLLAAAAELFAERGYHSVTLAEIGGAVGISGPGVYRHFKSKESLLGELLVDVSRHLLASARDRVASAVGPLDALARLVDFHAGFAVVNPALITVQARELSSLAPEAQRRVRRLQRTYVGVWAGTIAKAALFERPEEATAAAHAVFGLLNSTPFSARLDGQRMRALLASMALGALTGSGR